MWTGLWNYANCVFKGNNFLRIDLLGPVLSLLCQRRVPSKQIQGPFNFSTYLNRFFIYLKLNIEQIHFYSLSSKALFLEPLLTTCHQSKPLQFSLLLLAFSLPILPSLFRSNNFAIFGQMEAFKYYAFVNKNI